jgi:hypothetical protein
MSTTRRCTVGQGLLPRPWKIRRFAHLDFITMRLAESADFHTQCLELKPAELLDSAEALWMPEGRDAPGNPVSSAQCRATGRKQSRHLRILTRPGV